MSLKNWWARLNNQQTPTPSPESAELQRLIDAGDLARRERQPDTALGFYQQALDLARQRESLTSEELVQGIIGEFQTQQGHYEEAESALQSAIAAAERTGDRARRARAFGNLGAHYIARGLVAKAQVTLDNALEQARLAVAPTVTALILANQGAVYLAQDNPTYALRLLKEAVSLYQTMPLSEPVQAAYATGMLGKAHLAVGETDRAYRLLTQALQMSQQSGQPLQELTWSNALAGALYQSGALQQALKLYERCDELESQVPNPPLEYSRDHLSNRAMIYQYLGQPDLALSYALRALAEARAAVNRTAEARALTQLGEIHKSANRPADAIAALEQANALYNNLAIGVELAKRGAVNEAHVDTLLTLGGLYEANGETERGLASFDEALKLAEKGASGESSDKLARARALRRIGMAFYEQGEITHALEHWTEALDLFERGGQPAAAARLLCDTAMARRATGGINAALPDYERATMLLSGVKEPATRGLVLSNVANVYTDLGEIETAASFYQESIQLARQTNDRRAESLRLGNYGWFYVATGQPQQAIKTLEEALAISRPMGDVLLTAVQLHNLGQAYFALKDYGTAQKLYEQALGLIESADQPRWRATFRANLGRVLATQGRRDEAFVLFEQALATSRKLNDQENVARSLVRIADVQLQRGQLVEADAGAREAELVARKWGYRKGQADALFVRAGVARAQNDPIAAGQFLSEAIRLYGILHDPLATELAPQPA